MEAEGLGARFSRKYALWKERLLDLTAANRLLNFKPTKVATIGITAPKAEALYETLVIREQSLSFPLYRGRLRLTLPEDEEDPEPDGPDIALPLYSVDPGDLEASAKEPPALEKSLYRLTTLARSSKEERGINTLYLALGMLVWRPEEGANEQRAPLLLVPVELGREDRFHPYMLSAFDEDPEVNPTLVYMLKRDFDFALPSFDPDPDAGADELISFFLRIQDATAGRNWHVEDTAWLGQFNFKKLAMYRDLELHEGQAPDNDRVVAVAGLRAFRAEPDIGPTETFDQTSPSELFSVKDADHSQVEALLRARGGQNLIIQGPPGTGKSQTITNLIAQFLLDGKKVLFASEKMAALSVVHRRLEEVGLGAFCLEIHSDKANKRDTLARIDRAWNQTAPAIGLRARDDFQSLLRLRQELNEYARVLREPILFERSAFDIHAELARLDGAPQMTARLQVPVNELTPSRQQELLYHARRLAQVPGVLTRYADHPWNGCLLIDWSMDQQDLVRTRFSDLISVLAAAQEVATEAAADMSAVAPTCIDDFLPLLGLAGAFALSPCPPIEWFEADVETLRSEASDLSARQAIYHQRRSELLSIYSPRIFEIVSAELVSDLSPEGWRLPTALLLQLHQTEPLQAIAERGRNLVDSMRRVATNLSEVAEIGGQLAVLLGEPVSAELDAIRLLSEIGELVGSDPRPTAAWCDVSSLARIEAAVRLCAEKAAQKHAALAELRTGFSDEIFELPLITWKAANDGRYRQVFRMIYPDFRKHLAALRALHQSPSKLSFQLFSRAVALGAGVQEINNWFDDRSGDLATDLGLHYGKDGSDWAQIEQSLGAVRRVLELRGSGSLPEGIRTLLMSGGSPLRKAGQLAVAARELLVDLDARLAELQEEVDLPRLTDITMPLTRIDQTANSLTENADRLDRFLDRLAQLAEVLRTGTRRDGAEAVSDATDAWSTLVLEKQIAAAHDTLAERYPNFFQGLETDWNAVISALDWTAKFNPIRITMGLDTSCLEAAVDQGHVGRVRESHQKLGALMRSLRTEVEFLTTVFERRSIAPDTAFEQLPFEDLTSWVDRRVARVGEMSDWVQFQSFRRDAEKAGLSEFVAEAVERSIGPEQLEDALARRLLVTQLDEIYRQQPRLLRFQWRDQDDLVARFKLLDQQLMSTFSRLVQTRVKANQPDRNAAGGGQLGFLRRELTRQRRHAPLRRLFEQAGEVILDITPCLLMSPLSVATYLSRDSVKFDVVIFDEASQMPAEEAVGAILRGDQLIVAGDPKQLPPTRFFERSIDEEDFLEPDDEESLESVLEDCAASSMQRCLLEWHYRSKHESLVAFSNAEFYENRLVTFPSPSATPPAGVGVRHEYVQDGIYDRGGSSTNRPEGRRIAALIERHLETWGASRSLGVIALSAKQAEAVEDEVRLLVERRPDLEPLLGHSGEEPFFVKPLENVQGDERDTILITIGYGRKTSGEVLSHNFGPINHEGGERRLNVAVTRAKWELILVSSILASDIDEAKVQSSGPRVLKRYLAYAREGRLPPETTPPTGEAESWFEERVWEALKEHGIEADRNVGVSRYRIDLAIKHPAHPGNYLLGIECDGASYHSTKLARDRDRLRQQVLEGLGWKIHRIWSTDWTRDKRGAMERLLTRIDTLAQEPFSDTPSTVEPALPPATPFGLGDSAGSDSATEPSDAAPLPTPKTGDEYPAPLPQRFRRDLFDTDDTETIRKAVIAVVEHEGPIHEDLLISRVRSAFGIRRTGYIVESRIQRQIRRAQELRGISRRGEFLWPPMRTHVSFRKPGPGTDARKIEHVPPEEIEAALIRVITDTRGITRADAIPEARKLLGYDRAGDHIAPAMAAGVDRLVATKRIVEQGGFLRMTR